jgi:hypothetical protein
MEPTLTRIPPTTVDVPPLADEPVDEEPRRWEEPEPAPRPRTGC